MVAVFKLKPQQSQRIFNKILIFFLLFTCSDIWWCQIVFFTSKKSQRQTCTKKTLQGKIHCIAVVYYFPFLLLFFIVNFVVDKCASPPHHPWFIFNLTSLENINPPEKLLYSFNMCKLSVQKWREKKNHYYCNIKRNRRRQCFWAKFIFLLFLFKI